MARTTRTRTSTRASSTRSSRTPAVLKAEVGRFDGEMKLIHFNTGDTVNTILNKAGFEISEGETLTDQRGNEVFTTDTAKKDNVYYIAGNFKQGK